MPRSHVALALRLAKRLPPVAAASLQEVAAAGSDVRFVFYYDATEPLNSEDVRRNVNPEIICCRLPEASDGAARASLSWVFVVLLVMILLADTRSTTPRPCRRRRAPTHSPIRRRRALAPMRRFLVLASIAGASALQPLSKPPRLIVLAGLPGSGKSSLAAALERRGWAVVNQDSLGNRRKCERACARAFERGDRVAGRDAVAIVDDVRGEGRAARAGIAKWSLDGPCAMSELESGSLVVQRCL